MDNRLTFSPREERDQNGPDFRQPIKILLVNKEVGYFIFSQENIFQIFLYVDFFNQEGWREVLLDQSFSHESKCRAWLKQNMPAIEKGYKLHPLD